MIALLGQDEEVGVGLSHQVVSKLGTLQGHNLLSKVFEEAAEFSILLG